MRKQLTKKDLIKKLDRIFSEYIRRRDADEYGYCMCITCSKPYFWKDIHCGHFISRSKKAVRFHELNCHAQCVRCNSFRQGEPLEYRFALIEKYGKEAVENLEMVARLGGDETIESLQMKIAEYKEKLKELEK